MYSTTLVVFIIWILLASAQLKKVRLRGHNPGKCVQKNNGTLILVKDREDNNKLLICSKENGMYSWKTTDGSNPTGEFFNPGYDCSDILDQYAEAKDGFYWIKLSGNVPKKVWCDMTTDGGGFMLIGRKNSSITWSVPSTSVPVDPFGTPHWSCSLGDAPIVDFRIQVATKENFKETKTHWSFRLQNSRPLKDLLVVNEGGCGRLSPGIGHISYVKDLQTDKIVTTTFRCSQFGNFYPKSSRFGWGMMNYCLERPCRFGFAFHHKYPVQIDHSGAFSYSASGKTSGISHDSTSFVGCDNNHCCGCFGPLGGTGNYCGAQCKAKNGGTIVKNVYTWFWVRSSLPKRLWNKCMEYKVKTAKGKVVWYRLYDGNAVPVKGRCNQDKALLNDGIVVVPDGASAKKVPPVPGLLEYRKDTKKLYVMSNETWNEIAEEKKVLRKAAELFKPQLQQVEKKITGQFKTAFAQLKKSLAKLKTELASVNKKVNAQKSKSCASLYKSGKRSNGIYTIDPDGLGSFPVSCDMRTGGGGWTVIQRRQDGSVDFYRGWKEYKNGFGNLNGNFWLGLDKIHRLTKSGQSVLRVDLVAFDNTKAYAKYGTFTVASESDKYKLNVGSFSGNAGDALSYHNGMKFSTKDRDHDQSGNCAVSYKGAWWYKNCYHANLNGLYKKAGEITTAGITWYRWKNSYRSLKNADMKLRPSNF